VTTPEHIWNRELVLVTGKGGVGKTTVTAALARLAHQSGRRVLVAEVTSDPSARSALLSLFGAPSPAEDTPVELARGLRGVRIAPSTGHKLFLRAALKVRLLVDAAMKSAALNRFLMAAPAFPEIGTLFHLVSLLRERAYDHVIVDLPATGHALGLASLPRTVLGVIPSGLIGDAVREGLEAMTDPRRAGAVVVTLPESLPVTESLELAAGLARLSVPVRAMVLNRMPASPFTLDERAALDAHLRGRPAEDVLLGTRELRRLARAAAARDGFRADAPPGVPRFEIASASATDPRAVLEHVARALGAGEGRS
jgi:anion-transporting  ArsA/GET3 family ATPase